jgi:hypothetical protein
MTQTHRQGDVLLVPITADLPAGAKKVKRDNGRVILAYGEVTGHAHAITESWAELFEAADQRVLVLPKEVTLRHEEHTHQVIAPGRYRVVIQREYVPGALPRNVSD